MKKYFLLIVVLLVGCNQEQAVTATQAVGESYNRSYRDNVIKNWQNKISENERCSGFKTRFKVAGERYESAANGAFANDMMKIWEEAKANNCQYTP